LKFKKKLCGTWFCLSVVDWMEAKKKTLYNYELFTLKSVTYI